MKVVQVVLEAYDCTRDVPGVIDNRHNALSFFFGGKSSNQDIVLIGNKEITCLGAGNKCIGLLALRLRPLDNPTCDMRWIDERGRILSRLLSKK
jgi:hypothetical protein